jgi:hypothetical protein
MLTTDEESACTVPAVGSRDAFDSLAQPHDTARHSLQPAGVSRARRARHKLAYRVSINTLLWGRFYVTLFAGPERRSVTRLDREGQTSMSRQAILVSAIVSLTLTFSVFGLFCSLYLLKSVMGINVFPGGSPLHPLYELLLRG